MSRTVRLITCASWTPGVVRRPGETHVLADALTASLVADGAAEYLDAAPDAPPRPEPNTPPPRGR